MKKAVFVIAVVVIGAIVVYIASGSQNQEIVRSSLSSSIDEISATGVGSSATEQAPIPATRSRQSTQIAGKMSPQKALTDAHAISRCSRLGDGELSLPRDLTKEQRQQIAESRDVRGLDCSALSSPYSVYELVEFAAGSGDIQAQLDFSALAASRFNDEGAALDPALIAKYKADSRRFLEMAVRAGNGEAMSRLSESYDGGLFTPKDPVRAYAYAYARNQIAHSRFSQARLMQLRSKLSAVQQQQGQQIGQSILTRANH